MVKINWVRTSIACRTVPLRPKPQSVSKKAAPSVPPLGPPLLPKSTTRQGTCATSATRCPIAQPICKTERPPPAQTTQDHFAACHFAKPNPIPLAQAERVAPPLSCPPPVASAASTIAKSAGPRARLARSKKVAASTRRKGRTVLLSSGAGDRYIASPLLEKLSQQEVEKPFVIRP